MPRSRALLLAQILNFYYPGTTQQQVGNPPIRVHLSAYDSSGITMVAPPGQQMTVTDGATSATATGPATLYKIQIDATAMHILFLDPTDQTWKPFVVGATADSAGPVTFATPDRRPHVQRRRRHVAPVPRLDSHRARARQPLPPQ